MRLASYYVSAFLVVVGSIVACTSDDASTNDGSNAAQPTASSTASTDAGPTTFVSPTCVLPAAPPNPIKSVQIAPALSFKGATGLTIAPSGRYFVRLQSGKVMSFVGDDATTATTTLDISSRVETASIEDGFLGMALSPNFPVDGQIYYTFTAFENGGQIWALETAKTDGAVADPSTIKRVLTIPDYRGHHYGAYIAFGPDGMLYATAGDGDDTDPQKRAQNLGDLHGKMLRLDVSTFPYAVPPDNPFVSNPAVRPEIWAYGFRNPWKFGFDSKDGTLWLGDVGQYAREEINIVTKGGNYGWSIAEGTLCYNADTCDTSGTIPPVWEYQHPEGLAVVGGTVYRGSAIPSLYGAFIYGDWAMNWLRALTKQPDGTYASRFLDFGHWVTGFGEDPNTHEMSFVDYITGGVYRIENNDTPPMPATLKATGCADTADLSKAAPGFFPYDVNMQLWSDGADKQRFFALPPGGQIQVGDNGFLDLPAGSVVYKSFSLGGKPIEVRLMVHHQNGDWAGYSYMVRDDGSDADLVPESVDKQVGDQTWTFPGSTMCFGCHNNYSHRVLGLETAQLNQGSPNQLDVLSLANAFNPPLPPASLLPRLTARSDPDGDDWARAYLHANCAVCHRKDGLLISGMDFHYWTALKDMNVCRLPIASSYDAKGDILQPGDPDDSVLIARASRRGPGQMPPLATHAVDTLAITRLRNWISRTTSCPN